MFRRNPAVNTVSAYTQPKRKFLKRFILGIVLIILGAGLWVGISAFSALQKITASSDNGGSFFSILGDLNKNSIKGQSDGRTNILLLGMGGKNHPGGMLSDTMIVLSIDWKTKKMAMISVPRDLWVSIPNYGSAKINAAYAYGEQNAKITGGGGKVASDVINKVLDIPIHYYVRIDFEGFKKIVDNVNGVDVYVEKDLYDPYYPAANMIDYDPFKITTGTHHLDGASALKYARSRETTSDFDRSRRQEQVLVAVKAKTLTLNTLGNPKKVTDLMEILGEHLRTNMSVGEIKTLWESMKEVNTENVINKVFDTSAGSPLVSTQDERGYIILPKMGVGNFIELQKIAKNIFSEQVQGTSIKDYTIEVLNGSGKVGAANQTSQLLKNAGYNVTRVDTATKLYSKSTVYNCAGKPAANLAQEIADLIKAEVEVKTSCGTIDISVVIGQNNL